MEFMIEMHLRENQIIVLHHLLSVQSSTVVGGAV